MAVGDDLVRRPGDFQSPAGDVEPHAMQTPREPGAAPIALNQNSLFVKQEAASYFQSWRTLLLCLCWGAPEGEKGCRVGRASRVQGKPGIWPLKGQCQVSLQWPALFVAQNAS